MLKRIETKLLIIIVFTIFVFTACSGKDGGPSGLPDSTDQLFEEKKYNEVVYIFQMDEKTYMIDPAYEISFYEENLEDGHFYKLTADITYLNGGIAGYVDFPQIDHVIGCEEISPFDLNLPKTTEKRYGLTFIGDYAEGDIFLHEYRKLALWKDGSWIWKYDKEMDGEDGTLICYRDGVSKEEIEEGIAQGILSCEEYFVQPAIKTE